MKKNVIFIAAATLAIAAISCNKVATEIETPNTHEDEIVTITASAESATKTTYAGGTDFSWTTGDKISVLCFNESTSSYKYVDFTASSTGSVSTFTGTPGDGWAITDKALFPASAGHTYDASKSRMFFNVIGDKDATGTFSADLPMVGVKIGDNFHFTHCTGAAKITIDNIPAKYQTVEIEYSSPSLKLSGDFRLRPDGDYWYWEPEVAASDSEKAFKRTLTVSDNKAVMYLPYSSIGDLYTTNTMKVTGYDELLNATVIYEKSTLSSLSGFSRAVVKALTPLVLSLPDYSKSTPVYCGTSYTEISELKLAADKCNLYLQFRGTTASWTGAEFHLCMGDGSTGEGSENVYYKWTTKSSAGTKYEGTSSISTSSFQSPKFNDVRCCQTKVTTSGDETIWELTVPRSASTLLTSGTVYVGIFVLSSSTWSWTAAVPEIETVSSSLIPISLP